ncbi:hypothetical protein G7Z17_g8531 [Cylindrodendrum hubeiense]|uniref:Zn(2)-C6 fungal-type domain-containing protein n=1 Tax=Cylindrodendrum hubeiense TaxID=595255 RepID=A0A9P5HB07_9HYPO|nr:hypothetical protein G7Z17_g8531 [Cylindrodendrum hubeiense]
MRRFHQKSRLGCKQCKLRRSKCDEARPSCGRCSQANRQCSFLTEHPTLPASPLLSDAPVGHQSSSPEERYSSLHLSLLYHFEHGLYDDTKSLHPGLKDMLGVFMGAAFATPYLMDELLAYSAAHKSTLDQGTCQLYLSEATRLQTRALTLYNSAKPEVSEETCLPMFIFSSLLSHHAIFNVGSSVHNDFGAVIDGLTHSIIIHRGLIAIAKASWPMFSDQAQQQFIRSCQRDHRPIPSYSDSRGECEALLGRLDACDMKPASIDTLRGAVEILQDRFDTLSTDNSHAMWAAVQDWLVAVPAGYVELLEQRRPEALVVLAHFAVLLHRVAEHWFVGDIGVRLIRLINSHVGPVWQDWLEWPNRATMV